MAIGRKHYPPTDARRYLKEQYGIVRAVPTLAKLRCVSSDGPVFVKAGRGVLHPEDALDAYARSLLSGPLRSTSEYQPIARVMKAA